MFSWPNKIFNSFVDLIFPQSCVLCGDRPTILPICEQCNPRVQLLESDWLLENKFCDSCGGRIEEGETICLECRLFPLNSTKIRSLWVYNEHAQDLIKLYKYAGRRSLGDFFSEQLYGAINCGAFSAEQRYSWNVIIPVPSSKKILARRTYSPMGIITRGLAKRLKIDWSLLALKVRGHYPQQASLTMEQRLKNCKRKFAADPTKVKGKSILLVDDVITSGASILGSTLALYNAGAKGVDILSIARSEQFQTARHSLSIKYAPNKSF